MAEAPSRRPSPCGPTSGSDDPDRRRRQGLRPEV